MGQWYPQSADACARFLDAVPTTEVEAPRDAVAAIVPHAGWVYSGAIAFEALRQLKLQNATPDLILLFGGHLGPRHEPRLLIEGEWQTPFGEVAIPVDLAQDVAMGIECDIETPEAYYDDNAVEVQMPMIKNLWPDTPVLALGVPPTDRAPSIGREVLDLARRRGFEDIIVVGSTDLTHYGPNYDFQPHGRGLAGLEWMKTTNDPAAIERIEAMDGQKLLWVARRQQNACCPGAIAAAIGAANVLGATRGATTEYTTSYDVRPDGAPSSFVGYAGLLLGR